MLKIPLNEFMSSFSANCSLIHFMFSFSLEKVLEAITTAGEWRAIERFSPIVQGLRDRSVQLQVSAMYMFCTAIDTFAISLRFH